MDLGKDDSNFLSVAFSSRLFGACSLSTGGASDFGFSRAHQGQLVE